MNFISDYAGTYDNLVLFGLWATIGAIFITLILVSYILLFRSYQLLLTLSYKKFYQSWRPVLAQCSIETPTALPALKERYYLPLISLWNHYYEVVQGEAHDNLIEVARRIELDRISRLQIVHSDKKRILLGMLTLGNLQSKEDWPLLSRFIHDSDTNLSLVAMRALFRIHPIRAIHTLLPYLVTRPDYPIAQVATLIKRLPTNDVCPQLVLHMGINLRSASSNILRYMEACGCSLNRQVFESILQRQPDDHIVSTALALVNDPAALELILPFLTHQRWHIRVHAAQALGKLATREHIHYLVDMLKDEQWWVRYRAAQALVALPFMDQDQLIRIDDELNDRYGRDILKQAMAEHGV